MSDSALALGGLIILALVFLACAFVGMKRRKRLWFVGGGRTTASRLAGLRALQMRELRDLEDGHAMGKISFAEYEPVKESLLLEISEITAKLNAVEGEREALKKRFNLPALLLAFGLALFAQSALAQEALTVKPTYRAESGLGVVDVQLKDASGLSLDFTHATLAAVVLEDNDMPFNERTQASWTGMFRRIADINPPSGLGKVMSINKPGSATETIKGYAWKSNASGEFTVKGIATGKRIAFAVHFQGMWWPMLRELVLPADGTTQYAKITLSEIDGDTSVLRVTNYEIDIAPARDTGTMLRWHQVDVLETITIENPTSSAISGDANDESEGWLSFLIPAPPEVDSAELLNLMANTWGVFVGIDRVPESEDLEEIAATTAPYQVWSKGVGWGGKSAMHGAKAPERAYEIFGPKNSGQRTHPLNAEGRFSLMNAGDVAVVARPGAVLVNIYKPVPARSSMVIRLAYKAGMDYSTPKTVRVDRSNLPASILDMRATVSTLYSLGINGKDMPLAEKRKDGGNLFVAEKNAQSHVVSAGGALFLTIAPTAELRAELALSNKLANEREEQETKAAAAHNAVPVKPSESKKEQGLQWSSLMWLLAVLFGVGFLVSIVWITRGDSEKQRRKALALELEEDAVLAELEAMKLEAESGQLPAKVYLLERNRIIEGMITAKIQRESDKNQPKE